jgi:hypothetical protein
MASIVSELWKKVGDLKLTSAIGSSNFPFFYESNSTFQSAGIWKIYPGWSSEIPKQKRTRFNQISIFVCDGKSNDNVLTKSEAFLCAKNCIKRLKSLRHPKILNYLGSSEVKIVLNAKIIFILE